MYCAVYIYNIPRNAFYDGQYIYVRYTCSTATTSYIFPTFFWREASTHSNKNCRFLFRFDGSRRKTPNELAERNAYHVYITYIYIHNICIHIIYIYTHTTGILYTYVRVAIIIYIIYAYYYVYFMCI